MSDYDPDLRRDTPLTRKLKERIGRDGPISVADYMDACLNDPEHGYYRTQAAIGAQGDFITAPEISQVFGELIGLWCVIVWQQMGSPKPFNLIELGPGRGTLIRDALRAAKVVPGFQDAALVHLVESNAVLREVQRERLAEDGLQATWHGSLFKVEGAQDTGFGTKLAMPEIPTIIIGNEFIDTRLIHQYVKCDDGWHERLVATDDQFRLAFSMTQEGKRGAGDLVTRFPETPIGEVAERAGAMGDLTMPMREIATTQPLAALFIDYGHVHSSVGDTLQAVRNHAHEHPLTSPGEADVTAQVDFAQFARDMQKQDFVADGPVTQAEFLGQLGIMERTSRLMAGNPRKAAALEAGIARLMAPQGMGGRFKAIGIRSAGLPGLPGFEQ